MNSTRPLKQFVDKKMESFIARTAKIPRFFVKDVSMVIQINAKDPTLWLFPIRLLKYHLLQTSEQQ